MTVAEPFRATTVAPTTRHGRPEVFVMENTSLLSSLSLMTLVAFLIVIVAAFAYFLRRRRNRDAASHALGIDETKR